MPVMLVPYLDKRSQPVAADCDAYIPVRVPGPPRPDGQVLIYFLDGTARLVAARHLYRIETDAPSRVTP
jgi:hypothetical protein